MNVVQAAWTLADKGPLAAGRLFAQGGQIKKSRIHRWPLAEEPQSATMRAADAIAGALFGRRLPRRPRRAAGALLHFAFGGLAGALYGAAAEVAPRVTAAAGVPFGAAVWIAADETGVPLLRLSKKPRRYPPSVHAQSLVAHFAYGATVEAVRRLLRASA
jgi:hypothetical protein